MRTLYSVYTAKGRIIVGMRANMYCAIVCCVFELMSWIVALFPIQIFKYVMDYGYEWLSLDELYGHNNPRNHDLISFYILPSYSHSLFTRV